MKAQSSIEFVIIIGAVIFFFSGFLFLLQQNISDKSIQSRNLEIQKVALAVQEELTLAAESSDGYQRTFQIPDKILNAEYTLNITEGLLYLQTNDGKNAMTLPIPEVSGQLIKGQNTIKKTDGEILLNQ